MDVGTATLPRSRRRAWVQFSLRELLLLTLVAALALTIWRMARPLEPTPFMAGFSLHDIVGPAHGGRTSGLVTWVESGVLGGRKSGHGATKHAYHYRLDNGGSSAAVISSLPSGVKSLLAAAECEVLDEAASLDPELPGFFFRYRKGETEGVINVDSAVTGNELRIYVLIHEFRAR